MARKVFYFNYVQIGNLTNTKGVVRPKLDKTVQPILYYRSVEPKYNIL
ncbi:MAG: hypothetical protein MJA31_20270 [Clostridia bacterium]|nr:hypothetical protein [Clostridia bacterium]